MISSGLYGPECASTFLTEIRSFCFWGFPCLSPDIRDSLYMTLYLQRKISTYPAFSIL